MNPFQNPDFIQSIRRRTFLKHSAYALGSAALGSLLNPGILRATQKADSDRVLSSTHWPQKAHRVIHLCMAGGPSHLETFDYKPKLKEIHNQPFPESFTEGEQLAQLQGSKLKARGPFCEFKKWGKSGQEISELFPHIGGVADDICIIRSLHTEQINHDPAHAFMNSGSIIKARPSMGSWLLYGLGAETENLPGYVVLVSEGGGQAQPISARQWSSGFLPSKFQGIQFQTQGNAVHYVGNPEGYCQSTQREIIDEVNRLNGYLSEKQQDPEIATRISQYEMAFRMQSSVPELTDMGNEPQHMLDMYGVKNPGDGSFASNCLLARRLAERGVRFIQLYHRGWDHHGGIEKALPSVAKLTDQPSAALVADLKQRGMLENTLIIWGGEFGRTPMSQGSGRDHHINAFSIWMAGGGIKGGLTWGQTDELGYKFIPDDQAVHVHDLHATMLACFGINHKKLTYRYQGRDFRLTDIAGNIVKGILA